MWLDCGFVPIYSMDKPRIIGSLGYWTGCRIKGIKGLTIGVARGTRCRLGKRLLFEGSSSFGKNSVYVGARI